jgi:hypothetical protein
MYSTKIRTSNISWLPKGDHGGEKVCNASDQHETVGGFLCDYC